MTREEAESILSEAGSAGDSGFPLLEAAIACAEHDCPFRDPEPVRLLGQAAADRLRDRLALESPEEALAESLSGDLRLNGDLLGYDDPGLTDIIDVAETRRGLSAILSVFYIHAAHACGLKVAGVDFPGHVLLRLDIRDGPVALDPFSQGRLVLPSELSRRALRAGLTPLAADRLDLIMAPMSDRKLLVRLQNLVFLRAQRVGDHQSAERAALRTALLDPEDHRPWLDVAAAREAQGALNGALEALAKAHALDGSTAARADQVRRRVLLRLN